jgi:hypothetical protein
MFQERERPLILIGHGFGGLVVAHVSQPDTQYTVYTESSFNRGLVITQSLVKAFFRKDDDPILRATVGIIFFGVPHKGLVVTDMRRMLPDQHPRQELLDQISPKSRLLADQLANFKNIVENRKIISFYERQQTPGLKEVRSRLLTEHQQNRRRRLSALSPPSLHRLTGAFCADTALKSLFIAILGR